MWTTPATVEVEAEAVALIPGKKITAEKTLMGERGELEDLVLLISVSFAENTVIGNLFIFLKIF